MNSLKVRIREFRSQLPHYLLEVGQPLAITRHGEAIGYYTPARDRRLPRQVDKLKVEISALITLGRYASGVFLPRDS
jgi:antitoxin (DNA-binding transcriptional repressor) of toxin-antitoxin stability system